MANKITGAVAQQFSKLVKTFTDTFSLLSIGPSGVITNNSGTTKLTGASGAGDPSVSGDYRVFNGSSTQLLYSRNNGSGTAVWTFAPPFSIEWEMKAPDRGSKDQVIMTFGRVSSNNPYGELIIQYDAAGVGCYTQTASGGVMPAPKLNQWFAYNSAGGATALNGGKFTTPQKPVADQNYKYGLMCYQDGGVTYWRGYLNDVIVFDNPMTQYVVAANLNYGLSIGGTMDYAPSVALNGSIKNLRMDKRLFWPINTADPSNLLTMDTRGTITPIATATKNTAVGANPTYDTTYRTYTFNGSTQLLRYTDTNNSFNQITDPLSVEVDVYFNNAATAQVVLSLGQNDPGYPGIDIRIDTSGGFGLMSSLFPSNSAGGAQYLTYVPSANLASNTWYNLRFMIYTSGGVKRMRGWTNGVQVFDSSITSNSAPLDRIAIGSDYTANNTISRPLSGGIRRLKVTKSLLWTV